MKSEIYTVNSAAYTKDVLDTLKSNIINESGFIDQELYLVIRSDNTGSVACNAGAPICNYDYNNSVSVLYILHFLPESDQHPRQITVIYNGLSKDQIRALSEEIKKTVSDMKKIKIQPSYMRGVSDRILKEMSDNNRKEQERIKAKTQFDNDKSILKVYTKSNKNGGFDVFSNHMLKGVNAPDYQKKGAYHYFFKNRKSFHEMIDANDAELNWVESMADLGII